MIKKKDLVAKTKPKPMKNKRSKKIKMNKTLMHRKIPLIKKQRRRRKLNHRKRKIRKKR